LTSITDTENSDKFRGSLERMDRIQRDVQQLWKSITGTNQDDQTTEQQSDITIQKRLQTVWDNVNNYYNSYGNGSTIDGVLQSATDRVSRIGGYFQNIWRFGTDAFSDSKQQFQTHGQTISSMVSSLSDHLNKFVSTISQGVHSITSDRLTTKSNTPLTPIEGLQ